jgi:dihydroneopterin aldolase
MTRFLASVRSAEEALIALAGGADIVDAKEPSEGALGRIAPASLAEIVAAVGRRRPVSATIGDVELVPSAVRDAVEETAACGTDIVKIGLFDGDLAGTFTALAPLAARGNRLVAVAFADRRPDLSALLARCAEAGFWGVMLDTAQKTAGPLTAHCPVPLLAAFVDEARSAGLVTGLAGSLRLADVPRLARIGPDYLGFRSALTKGKRAESISPEAVRAVREAIVHASAASRRSATETAGATAAASGASSGVSTGTSVSKPA